MYCLMVAKKNYRAGQPATGCEARCGQSGGRFPVFSHQFLRASLSHTSHRSRVPHRVCDFFFPYLPIHHRAAVFQDGAEDILGDVPADGGNLGAEQEQPGDGDLEGGARPCRRRRARGRPGPAAASTGQGIRVPGTAPLGRSRRGPRATTLGRRRHGPKGGARAGWRRPRRADQAGAAAATLGLSRQWPAAEKNSGGQMKKTTGLNLAQQD